MRCPHCAVPLTLSPTCWACGLSPSDPVEQKEIEGFEPNRRPPVNIDVPLMPELLTRPMTGRVDSIAPLAITCATCGADMINTTTCPSCGAERDPHVATPEVEAPDAKRTCSQCGVPNPPHRKLCVGCASRLSESDHAF